MDTAKARADQLNVTGQIGFGSSGISGVMQKANGDTVVVSEQSGIHAGTGGLDVDVSGQTSLVGGLITSEAAANLNTFNTGTLDVTDIDTHSSWKAETCRRPRDDRRPRGGYRQQVSVAAAPITPIQGFARPMPAPSPRFDVSLTRAGGVDFDFKAIRRPDATCETREFIGPLTSQLRGPFDEKDAPKAI
ncbi:hypothetical protein ACVITL_006585 [Rhizobium pisi]